MVLSLQHAMYFFWHRYELPALYTGYITPMVPRMVIGDVIGQSISQSSMSFQINSEFSTNAVVLEDEIELSRRIQQRQLVDLFLPAEVQRRQHQAELAMAPNGAAPVSPADRPSNRTRASGFSPPISRTPRQQGILESPSRASRSFQRNFGTCDDRQVNRRARIRDRIEFLDRNLPANENDVAYSALRTSESAQSLFDFASAN